MTTAEVPADRFASVRTAIQAIIEAGRRLEAPRVTPFAGAELNRRQLEILYLLAHRSEVTPTSLAGALRVTLGAVTQLVAGLRELGLVQSSPRPGYGRSIILTLTDPAAEQVEQFETAFVRDALPLFADLGDHHLQHLTLLLGSIKEAP